MERISCERQVVINSRIQPIDCALISTTNWGYLASQIEGTLEIYVNGRNFFSEPNILLIELAQVIYIWLNNEAITFYYQSMDYEEEPIIQISPYDNGKFLISSIWVDYKCEIELGEWIQACKDFLSSLDFKLKKYGLNLNKFLNLAD